MDIFVLVLAAISLEIIFFIFYLREKYFENGMNVVIKVILIKTDLYVNKNHLTMSILYVNYYVYVLIQGFIFN